MGEFEGGEGLHLEVPQNFKSVQEKCNSLYEKNKLWCEAGSQNIFEAPTESDDVYGVREE